LWSDEIIAIVFLEVQRTNVIIMCCRGFAFQMNPRKRAMAKLSDAELEMVYKNGWKPSDYLANKEWFSIGR
jgi:hypothetical protein